MLFLEIKKKRKRKEFKTLEKKTVHTLKKKMTEQGEKKGRKR